MYEYSYELVLFDNISWHWKYGNDRYVVLYNLYIIKCQDKVKATTSTVLLHCSRHGWHRRVGIGVQCTRHGYCGRGPYKTFPQKILGYKNKQNLYHAYKWLGAKSSYGLLNGHSQPIMIRLFVAWLKVLLFPCFSYNTGTFSLAK